MFLKQSGDSTLTGKFVMAAMVAVIAVGVIFAVYLAMPDTTYITETEDAGRNNYSREDFYTEYLDMVAELSNSTTDLTADTLSQSVINAGSIQAGSWQAQLAAMDARYPGYSKNFTQLATGTGITYLQEGQTKTYWGKCIAGSGSTMSSAGCFYFAASGLITNKTGVVYTVADILTNGNDSCKDIRLNYDARNGFSVSGGTLSKVGGSSVLLQQTIDRSPLNARVKVIADSNRTGLAGAVDEGRLKQGTWYFLHTKGGSDGILSNGEEHWLLLVGADAGNYYFANNANRNTKVPRSTVDRITFNHIWEIEVL